MLELLLSEERFLSPSSAGVFASVPLRITKGAALDEEVLFLIEVVEQSANARFSLDLYHGMDGKVTLAHTTDVIASAARSNGDLIVGDASRSVMRMDVLHPILKIGSTGSGNQWMALNVWQMRKRYNRGPGQTRHLGVFRFDSSSTTNTGLPLPGIDFGGLARSVTYHARIMEATASAQLGLIIQHGPDGRIWAAQRTVSPQTVTEGAVAVVDCDLTKGLAKHIRPVVTMQSGGGYRVTFSLFETLKEV